MRIHRCFAVSVFSIFLLTFSCITFGQQRTTPQANDPELYLIGLRFVQNIQFRSLVETDPVKKASLHTVLLKDIGISEDDLNVLLAESQRTLAIVSPKGAKNLQGTARTAAISAAMQRLRGSLSSTGWRNFQLFVNGPLRQSTVIVTASNTTQK
jgi:hypothetical protein